MDRLTSVASVGASLPNRKRRSRFIEERHCSLLVMDLAILRAPKLDGLVRLGTRYSPVRVCCGCRAAASNSSWGFLFAWIIELPEAFSCRGIRRRPHEPYDLAIAGIFIVLMLVVTVLVFALA